MRVVEQLSTEINQTTNTLICEHCCKMLVTPKQRWLENLREYAYVAAEIVGLVAQVFGLFLYVITVIFAAIFPDRFKQKHPYVEEIEKRELKDRLTKDIKHFRQSQDRANWFADRSHGYERREHRQDARDYQQRAEDAERERKRSKHMWHNTKRRLTSLLAVNEWLDNTNV